MVSGYSEALEEAIFANPDATNTHYARYMLALFSDWCKKQPQLPESMQQAPR